MDCFNCKNCKHGDVSKEPRTIVSGNSIIYQSGNGVKCTNSGTMNITITDGEMVCSAFEPKERE